MTDEEFKQLTAKDFHVLKNLLLGYDFAINHPSLFELYDFSIIPIEFISNVYELFIGKDNQKEAGAYYTPLFLVDYILKATVEKNLYEEGNIEEDKKYTYCKVLDPDLEQFRDTLLNEIREIVSGNAQKEIPRFIKSREARKLLQISAGTLQQLRITGVLTYKKIGGNYYYKYDDIRSMLS